MQGGYCFYNPNTGKLINRKSLDRAAHAMVTRIEELAKRGGLTIDDSDGGLYEIAVVSRNSMESSDNDVTEMTSVASESTGVDAETTGLTNDTTGVAVDVQVAQMLMK